VRSVVAQGETYWINSTGDEPDLSLGDNLCKTAENTCTLRAAIEQANFDLSTEDIIGFDIPGGLVSERVIRIDQALPTISSPVRISGPNYTDGAEIVLDGQGGQFSGLVILSTGIKIDDIAISNFGGNGIEINGVDNVTLTNCEIGASHGPSKLPGNNLNGLDLENSSYVNISGNLISGNGKEGVEIKRGGNNLLTGNKIGTDINGEQALANGGHGIFLDSTTFTQIGGTNAGEGNLIAYNRGDGVIVQPNSIKNQIVGNAIFNNVGLGINLVLEGENPSTVTQNDLEDIDTGANQLQNFPVLNMVNIIDSITIEVIGYLNSSPSQNYAIHFYGNENCDSSDYGEGQDYLGMTNILIGDNGRSDFSISLSVNTDYQCISATATDSEGNTSEFSRILEMNIPCYQYFPIVIR
jgi:parallel beta-helix repeat protein